MLTKNKVITSDKVNNYLLYAYDELRAYSLCGFCVCFFHHQYVYSYLLGMGDIEIFAYDYCEDHDYHDYCFHSIFTEN